MSGELKQVIAFFRGELEPARDCGYDLFRRCGSTPLLDPTVIVGRDVAERRNFLATQAGCPAAATARESDVLGLERTAPRAEKISELVAVHIAFLRRVYTLVTETVSIVKGAPRAVHSATEVCARPERQAMKSQLKVDRRRGRSRRHLTQQCGAPHYCMDVYERVKLRI
jgi:hypothetical protein